MKLFSPSLLACAIACVAIPAQAQNTIWSNNSSTSFESSLNWNNGVPIAGYNAYVVPNGIADPTGAFLVTPGGLGDIVIVASASHTAASLNITNDVSNDLPVGTVNITFNNGTNFSLTGGVNVRDGEALTFNGTLFVGGSVNVGTDISPVGFGGGHGGSFTLNNGVLDVSVGNGIFVGNGIGNTASFAAIGTSSVLVANALTIGGNGSTATFSLSNTSTLSTVGANAITVGAGGNGTLTLNDSSVFSVNNGSVIAVGSGTGGNGTVAQTGAGSLLKLAGNAQLGLGTTTGIIGIYNLQGGELEVGTTAGDTALVTVGAVAGGIGKINQTGGSIVSLAGTTFDVGVGGTGTYNMSGGTASLGSGLTLGATGTLNLTGGTMSVAEDHFTKNAGTITLGGGTLFLTAGADNAITFGNLATLTGGNSTINASMSGLNTVTFGNALTMPGGSNSVASLTLIGNGATQFTFASAGGGTANAYNGSTAILNGTLNASTADLAGSLVGSTLTIGTAAQPATLNLSTGTTAGSTSALSQAIVGTGALNVNFGAATQTLELANATGSASTVNVVLGANTGAHPTTSAGTLQILSGSFGNLTDLSAGVGSNLIVGDGTTAGSVSFGTVTAKNSTIVMANAALGATSLTSTTVTNEGTLVVTNAITGLVANDLGSLITGRVVGDVSNSGTMKVTGAGGITGNVTSNSGTLSVLGATGVTGNVTNSGTFTALSANTLASTGYVTTVAPLGTLAVAGAYTQTGNGGAFGVNISGVNSNSITAMTADNLSGKIIVKGASAGNGATVYDIIDTTGGTSDAGLLLVHSFLLNASLAVVGNDLQLTVTTNPIVGNTPNQNALAASLNATPNNPVTVAITNNLSLTAADVPGILQSLIPENLQYARFINIENVNYMVQRIDGISADLRNGNGGLDTNAISVSMPGFQSGMGRSLGSLLAYNDPGFHQSAPNGVNYYPGEAGRNSPSPSAHSSDATEPATFDSSSQVISDSPNPYLADVKPGTSETPRLNEFIGGDVILADLNQNPSANANSKASYTAGDVNAGVSYRVTNHFAAGVLFDYNHTDADTDNNGGKTKIDSYTPGIFATFFDKGFYVNALGTVGLNEYKYNSNTFLGPTSGSPEGEQYTGNLSAGYDFHPSKNWIVGPTAGLTYTHVDIDSFTEDGIPGAALNVDSQSVDSLRSRLGGHVVFQTNTGDVLLQPNLTLMWQHEFLNDSDGITSSFANTSINPFTIETAAPSRDSALIGVGLTATLSNSMALYLNYMADVGASNYFSQSVYGGLKARF